MSMKSTLYLLFNHTLTPAQESDAYGSLEVGKIRYLPEELRSLWREIPPDMEALDPYLERIYRYLATQCHEGDYLLVQGDFGATFLVVEEALRLRLRPVYATTKRQSVEKNIDGEQVKTSVFSHIRYREYGV